MATEAAQKPGVYLNLMMSYSGHCTKEGIKYENSVYFKIGKSQNLDARGDRLLYEYDDAIIMPICYILTNGLDRSDLESKLLEQTKNYNLNLVIQKNATTSYKKETRAVLPEVVQKFMDIGRSKPEYTFLKSPYIDDYYQFIGTRFQSNILNLVEKYFEESEYTILNDMHSHAINKSMIRDAKTFVENYQFEEYYSSDEDEYDDPDDSDYVDDPDDDDPDDSDFEP
jgi:hypothetical protein